MLNHDTLYTWLVDASQVAFARRDYPAARQALYSAVHVAVAGQDLDALAEVVRLGVAQQTWLLREQSSADPAYRHLLDYVHRQYATLASYALPGREIAAPA